MTRWRVLLCLLVFLPVLSGCEEPDDTQLLIPAGPFLMGNFFGSPDEAPLRVVTVSAFLVDKFEVTNRRYNKCVESGDCLKNTEW